MTACIVNGQRCTACCRAISLANSRRALAANAHRDKPAGDMSFILANWKPISRRRAKKKNPYMVLDPRHAGRSFWHCRRVTDEGCSVHATRPRVCRDYPLYDNHPNTLAVQRPEYHPDCTEWPRTQIPNVIKTLSVN